MMNNRDDLKYLHGHHEIASKYIGMARVYLSEGNSAAAAEALDKFCVQSDELTALYQPATAKMMGLARPSMVPTETLAKLWNILCDINGEIYSHECIDQDVKECLNTFTTEFGKLIDQAERQEKQ